MNSDLLERAIDWRSGILARAQPVPTSLADIDVCHWAVTEGPVVDHSAAGGVGWSNDHARAAAIGEGIERYAAWASPIPLDPATLLEVLTLDDFSYFDSRQRAEGLSEGMVTDDLVDVHPFGDGESVLVPAGLVSLNPRFGRLATSSGLAADPNVWRALLRGTEELIERDALMTTWVHGVAARRIPMPERLDALVAAKGGDAAAFDLTPSWSPHPVIAVAGSLPLRGRKRRALGCACRSDAAAALEKAWLEWVQGTLFAGYEVTRDPDRVLLAEDVRTFEDHGVFYSLSGSRWDELPLWNGPATYMSANAPWTGVDDGTQLRSLHARLRAAGVRLFHRELTTPDVAGLGMRVVRVLSPDLVPIHVDHRAPYLGGRAAEVKWRYPWVDASTCRFPSPFPHPLG